MVFGFPTTLIKEGAAVVSVPRIEVSQDVPFDRAISRARVFYNPRMRLNRDTAVLALRVHRRRLSKPISICEPMCGTGIRGIRLALEVEDVQKIVLGDLNPSAVRLAEENAAANEVSDKIRVRLMDANLLLSLHDRPSERFDYVDVDPPGSPSRYLEVAARACKDGGMVALTATDMAPLCGVNPKACLRKYGGWPIRTEYSHETALRLLIGAMARAAAKAEAAVFPAFSFASDHYVRAYVTIGRGAIKADRCLTEMGYLLHCFKCLNRRIVAEREPIHESCEVCGSRMVISGPMWMGKLTDEAFSEEMMSASEETSDDQRLWSLIHMIHHEATMPPTFYEIDQMCSRLGIESLDLDSVLSSLRESGFRATGTHFDERGLKTDAPINRLNEILCQLAGRAGRCA